MDFTFSKCVFCFPNEIPNEHSISLWWLQSTCFTSFCFVLKHIIASYYGTLTKCSLLLYLLSWMVDFHGCPQFSSKVVCNSLLVNSYSTHFSLNKLPQNTLKPISRIIFWPHKNHLKLRCSKILKNLIHLFWNEWITFCHIINNLNKYQNENSLYLFKYW